MIILESVALKNGEELEHYCMVKQRNNGTIIIIGTIFNSILSTGENLPKDLDFTIRYSYPYKSDFSTNLKYRFSKPYKCK